VAAKPVAPGYWNDIAAKPAMYRLSIGMTVDQVLEVLGEPASIIKEGISVDSNGVRVITVIYGYEPSVTVIFKNGRLFDYKSASTSADHSASNAAAPPTASSVKVTTGMTVDQSVAVLGQPKIIVGDLATKLIYIYRDIKLIFINGQITDIQ
jgi:hypothetical protein